VLPRTAGWAVDADGDVYTTDYWMDRVVKFSSNRLQTCLNLTSVSSFLAPIGVAYVMI
jgi:hypothetical protein